MSAQLTADSNAQPMRIGIFGGSFDPVHNAHLALAKLALTELQLDELLWVPAGQPWQKSRLLSSAADRVAMLALAIEGEPRFVLSPIELERAGPSYMLDTVRVLQAERPNVQWFLVIGQDQYAGFHTWHGCTELIARITLAVAARPDASGVVDPRVLALPHRTVALPMMAVSSTDIRGRIAHGQGIADLVPHAVASYIARHHLYQELQGDPPRGS